MSKNLKIVLVLIILVILIFGILFVIDFYRMKNDDPVLFSTWGMKYSEPVKLSEGINVALTLEDEIIDDTVWCGTFALIWNDLKNELAKQDIVFTPQLKVVENLNKGTFNTSMLSEDSYYKVHGKATFELKAQIEKAIKQKFNETSDILDDFDWENTTDGDGDFLYTMLKKEFQFEKAFNELEDGIFGEYSNVKYFGINSESQDEVKSQIKVLYYNSSEDFAIKLITKQNDEIIVNKGGKGNTFGEVYQNILKRNDKYKGKQYFTSEDTFKMPNIKFKVKEEFEELENKIYYFSDGTEHYIEKAMQTIQFELDKNGGKIKSEAGIMNKDTAAILQPEIRYFNVDTAFNIFLTESGKEMPYFAAKIKDITKFQ